MYNNCNVTLELITKYTTNHKQITYKGLAHSMVNKNEIDETNLHTYTCIHSYM